VVRGVNVNKSQLSVNKQSIIKSWNTWNFPKKIIRLWIPAKNSHQKLASGAKKQPFSPQEFNNLLLFFIPGHIIIFILSITQAIIKFFKYI